jgi:flagellar protein FliO/FliZ
LNANARGRPAQRAWLASQFCVLLCAAGRLSQAAPAAVFAAPERQALPGSSGGLLRVTLALIVVLAVLLAAAWLARRVRAFGGGSSPQMQILAQLPLGTRERAVLIRVGERALLIGVAPGNVRTLHVLEQPWPADDSGGGERAGQPALPTFKALLRRSLGK